AISARLGITRSAVWKHIRDRRKQMPIDSKTNEGYCLRRVPDVLHAGIYRRALTQHRLGQRPVILPEVDSTNSEAKRRCIAGQGEGALVVAGRQSAGRGRKGRRWLSQDGQGLWMSLVVQPQLDIAQIQKITLLTAVSVCDALTALDAGLAPVIKWPNDVLLGGRKLCGILCEMISDMDGTHHVILGIGVNLRVPEGGFDSEIAHKATALSQWTDNLPPRLALAAAIVDAADGYLQQWQTSFVPVVTAYRRYMLAAGSQVVMMDGDAPGQQAVVQGVDDDGALLLQTQDGVLRIISGEISIRGRDGYV
ncbi:MAG: biotin--[acetyl-CoA-carboxylase] ligase, partial [Eubacteriales bacterium]|nr:biotin--[acetyl-CoA-carboxylase] ligase [Eubacteriales bacterium]